MSAAAVADQRKIVALVEQGGVTRYRGSIHRGAAA